VATGASRLDAIKLLINRQRASLFRGWMRAAAQPFPFDDSPALIIAPHPDDEVLGCGGLISLKRKSNVEVSVAFVTAGEAAHDKCCSADRGGIAAKRRALAEEALAVLGATRPAIYWLGFPDEVAPLPQDDAFESMVGAIARCIEASGANQVFVPHYYDAHRDHMAVSLATIKAIERRPLSVYFYCVWSLYAFARRPIVPMFAEQPFALSTDEVRAQKARAVHAYFHERVAGCGAPVSGRLPGRLIAHCLTTREYYFPAKIA
jgi:LmbE family N-acetylglucosaminyl deacetylase